MPSVARAVNTWHMDRSAFVRFHLERVDSTMDEARRLSGGVPFGSVRADAQHKGRGRLPGRVWLGEAGLDLAFTAWLPADSFGSAPPPLLAGLAVLDALVAWAGDAGCAFPAGPWIKWPNDILGGRGKLAGILCEASGGVLYVGIGVNLAGRPDARGFRTPASSVRNETGRDPGPECLETAILGRLAYLVENRSDWLGRVNGALAYRGQSVSFMPGLGNGAPVAGTLSGVDERGHIVIATDRGPEAHASGELDTARPICH